MVAEVAVAVRSEVAFAVVVAVGVVLAAGEVRGIVVSWAGEGLQVGSLAGK